MDAADHVLDRGGRGGVKHHERGRNGREHARNAPARENVYAADFHLPTPETAGSIPNRRPSSTPIMQEDISTPRPPPLVDGVPPPSAARRDASPYPCRGGPRSRAAANWESRLPGGAFPPRPQLKTGNISRSPNGWDFGILKTASGRHSPSRGGKLRGSGALAASR